LTWSRASDRETRHGIRLKFKLKLDGDWDLIVWIQLDVNRSDSMDCWIFSQYAMWKRARSDSPNCPLKRVIAWGDREMFAKSYQRSYRRIQMAWY
jgi:hypothetical protein